MTILDTGKKEYVIRFTTQSVIDIEDRLGNKNMLCVFNTIMPSTRDLMTILHGSLQSMNHGIKMEDVYSIYDDYLANGGTMQNLMHLLIDGMRDAGILPKEDEPKNMV